jgi:glycerol-3-phosphate dehydrogenase subunit B
MLSDPATDPDVSPLGYARLFEQPEFRRAVGAELGQRLEPDEAVGFPSVLGLERHAAVREELEELLGQPVFEVPSLPPSVPGMRLHRALDRALRRAGGRAILGPTAVGADHGDGVLKACSCRRPQPDHDVRGLLFVLASAASPRGDPARLHGEVRDDPRLPVAGVPAVDEPRFLPGYFADHPMARAGVAVDDRLRPVDAEGGAIYENLVAVGAVLSGAEPWREHSGNGLALATAYAAASQILEGAS